MFNGLATFILRYRPAVLAFFIIATVVMGYQGSKVKLSYENNKLVPTNDKDFITYLKFKKEFGEDGNKVVIGFQSEQLDDSVVYFSFFKAIEKIKHIKGVQHLISATHYYILEKDDENARFLIKQMPERRPQNSKEIQESLQHLNQQGLYKNMLINEKGNATAAFISFDILKLDSEERAGMMATLKEACKTFHTETGIEMAISGIPYVRNEYANMVKSEFLKFTFLAIAVTAVFLLFFFRSLTNIVIPLMLVAVSVIWSLGIIVSSGYKLTVLTGIIPPLMVVIGIPNCIYLLNKYHSEYRKHGNKIKALTRIVSKVGPANVLTNITTAIGFGVFYFTKTSLLTQFGVVTFFSILSISLLTVILLPVIYSYLPAPRERQTKHLENKNTQKFIAFTQHVIFNKRRAVYFFTFVLLLSSLVGVTKLRPLVFVVDDIPSESKVRQDLHFFEEQFKGIMPLEIIIDSGEKNGMKKSETIRKINTLQNRLVEYEELAKPMSIVNLVSASHQAWNNGQLKQYRLPNKTTMGKISNYLGGMDLVDNQISIKASDSDYRRARISIQMADVGSIRMKTLTDEINLHINDIFPKEEFTTKITGTSYLFMVGNRYLLNSLFQSILIAFILIAIIMGSLFTSFKMMVVSLVPNTVPLLITAGIMGWSGVPLKPSTILVFSIAFGIATDDTIHFLAKFRQELKRSKKSIKSALSSTIQEVGTSLVYTSIVLFFGFIIFAFSDFQGTISLGILTSVSLFFALFSNIFVLPSLIMSFEKRLNPRTELKESVIELPNENEE
jgi:uncharacterized protein